jgi:hypothetical protein
LGVNTDCRVKTPAPEGKAPSGAGFLLIDNDLLAKTERKARSIHLTDEGKKLLGYYGVEVSPA